MNFVPALTIAHLFANALALGGVFMNAFIVWPAAAETLGRRGFPLEFFVMEGRRIAPWLYLALGMMLASESRWRGCVRPAR